jgi:hypothetical protein
MSSVCSECIRESWLAADIRENAGQHECNFCEEAAEEPMAIELGEMIDHIRERIEGPLSISSRMSYVSIVSS